MITPSKEEREKILFWAALAVAVVTAVGTFCKDNILLGIIISVGIILFLTLYIARPALRPVTLSVFGLLIVVALIIFAISWFRATPQQQDTPTSPPEETTTDPESNGWSDYDGPPKRDFEDLKLPGEE